MSSTADRSVLPPTLRLSSDRYTPRNRARPRSRRPPFFGVHPNVGRRCHHRCRGCVFGGSRTAFGPQSVVVCRNYAVHISSFRPPRRIAEPVKIRTRYFRGVADPASRSSWTVHRASRCSPAARQAWLDAQQAGWGDPVRLHRPGRLAAQALDQAREVVASAVGARPDEVIFTASAAYTQIRLQSPALALGRRRVGSRIVTTAIDHSSVLAAAAAAGHARRGRSRS